MEPIDLRRLTALTARRLGLDEKLPRGVPQWLPWLALGLSYFFLAFVGWRVLHG